VFCAQENVGFYMWSSTPIYGQSSYGETLLDLGPQPYIEGYASDRDTVGDVSKRQS
jgi:hypothetical protein